MNEVVSKVTLFVSASDTWSAGASSMLFKTVRPLPNTMIVVSQAMPSNYARKCFPAVRVNNSFCFTETEEFQAILKLES